MAQVARLSRFSPKIVATLFSIFLAACGGGGDSSGGTSLNPAPSGNDQVQNNGKTVAPPPSAVVNSVQPPDKVTNGTAPAASPPSANPAPVDMAEPAWSVVEVTGLVRGNEIKDMNDADVIVGLTVHPDEIPAHGRIPYQDPFILKNGQVSSLGNFGSTYGGATGINNAGQIAGYSYVGDVGQTHAFLYENGALKDIGIFIGPGGSWAQAINESGQVAVYASDRTYVYDDGDNSVRVIPGEQFLPADMNNAGQIAGTQLTTGAATFYDGTTLISLAPLVPKTYSLATGLNNAGQVIGDSYGATGTDYQGFLYSAGIMHTLTAPGSIQSHAASINNAGDVVGWIENADQQWYGFLYRNGTLTDLNSLPGIAASGWVLTSALKINNAGQILAGGYFNGQSGYCLLTPPH